jgi:predicted nucleotidyltransferase
METDEIMLYPKNFQDREFIRTAENFFFCVVGDFHPEDRAIAYLRYAPSSNGSWKFEGVNYRRAMPTYSIPNLLSNIIDLKNNYPDYVFYSDVFNVEISTVPRKKMMYHYIPQNKMKILAQKNTLDKLQQKAVNLAKFISETSEISFDLFGVTGSILIDLHNPKFSDIDLTIMGGENSLKLKKLLPDLYSDRSQSVSKVSEKILDNWNKEKMNTHYLTLDEIRALQSRHWNYGLFDETVFSIHPIRSENDATYRYGDHIFHSLGLVTGKAVIGNTSEALFNPHIYYLERFNDVNGHNLNSVKQVVSYSGFYGGIFEEGDKVLIKGKLELAKDTHKGKDYHRIIIGSTDLKGNDFIKLMP